jgi:hypothetical protein
MIHCSIRASNYPGRFHSGIAGVSDRTELLGKGHSTACDPTQIY